MELYFFQITIFSNRKFVNSDCGIFSAIMNDCILYSTLLIKMFANTPIKLATKQSKIKGTCIGVVRKNVIMNWC